MFLLVLLFISTVSCYNIPLPMDMPSYHKPLLEVISGAVKFNSTVTYNYFPKTEDFITVHLQEMFLNYQPVYVYTGKNFVTGAIDNRPRMQITIVESPKQLNSSVIASSLMFHYNKDLHYTAIVLSRTVKKESIEFSIIDNCNSIRNIRVAAMISDNNNNNSGRLTVYRYYKSTGTVSEEVTGKEIEEKCQNTLITVGALEDKFRKTNTYLGIMRAFSQITSLQVVKIEYWSMESLKIMLTDMQTNLDYMITGTFYGAYTTKGYRYSLPIKRNDIVIVVPKAGQVSHIAKFLKVFSWELWLCLVSLLGVTGVLFYYIERRDGTISVFIATIINTAYYRSENFQSSSKVLFVTWLFMGMFISWTFSSSILGTLIHTEYQPQMNKLADLNASGMPVYTTQEFGNLSAILAYPQISVVESADMYAHFLALNKEFGYMMLRSEAEEYINYFTDIYKVPHFHIMEETFYHGYEAFYMSEKTMYAKELDQAIQLMQTQNHPQFDYKNVRPAVKQHIKATAMTFMHLQSAFFVLGIGWILSGIAFVVEMIISKFIRGN